MAFINVTGPLVRQPDGTYVRTTIGTNGADHFTNLVWGDLVFGGNGDDFFDVSSNIAKLGPNAGDVIKIYGDDNAVYWYGPRANGRNPATADHNAPHVPGANIEDAGNDFANVARGVWFLPGNGADGAAYHGPGDPNNPFIFLGWNHREGDYVLLDHDLGLEVRNIVYVPGTVRTVNGMLEGELKSLDLYGESSNHASPNAIVRLDYGDQQYYDDRRGPDVPFIIQDTDRDGALNDQLFRIVERWHDGVGNDFIFG